MDDKPINWIPTRDETIRMTAIEAASRGEGLYRSSENGGVTNFRDHVIKTAKMYESYIKEGK